MPFFDRVVQREVVAEFFGYAQEGADAHARGPFAGAAGVVEFVPGCAEVVVLLRALVSSMVVGVEVYSRISSYALPYD